MIDFKELPRDGRAFEQFVREICLVLDLHPEWSGQGPDQGRDLILTEQLSGQFGPLEQRWLVQCKHFAHGGRAVGREDVGSYPDDCRQIGADGYLLATSTHPSSGLVMKLNELSSRYSSRLRFKVWDSVDFEKMMAEPRLFSLAHLFFPQSMSNRPWQLYNSGSPNHWTAHYKSYFLFLSSRISGRYPDLNLCEVIVGRLAGLPRGLDEEIRPRAIFFDDKHAYYRVFADYLVPHGQQPQFRPSDFNKILSDSVGLDFDQQYQTYWDIAMHFVILSSDHFDQDHYNYYNPFASDFRWGADRQPSLSELIGRGNRWLDLG